MDYDTVTYGYNNARLRNSLSLQQPTGNWTNGFNYDAARRLSTVISPAGTYTYSYKGPGVLVTNLVLPNTSRITNAFDNVGRLTLTRLRNRGGTALNTHSYLYNQGHQRYRQTRTDSSYVTYTYDNIGQLKSAIGTGGESTENLGYTYDTAWNLNTRTNYGVSQAFAVNVKNELTNAVGLASSYDANGNLTNRVYDATGPKTYIYLYDDENQLIEMRTDTSATPTGSRWRTAWAYDGLGRARVRTDYTWSGSAWAVSETTQYVYDGMRVIQERNGSNTPTVSYTRGNDLSGSLEGAGGIGGLLGRSHGYSSGTWSTHNHYHADGNGNVTYLVNSGQTSEAIYRYDPYGRTMSQSGSLATANRYRFSSKEVHSQSGVYYYGFRFYEPHLQRWLNRDPLGDEASLVYVAASIGPRIEPRSAGETAAIIEAVNDPLVAFTRVNLNLYGALGNNPISNVDPLGLDFGSCYADCLEQYRNPITEQLPNWIASKSCPGFEVWPYSGAAGYGANALGNKLAGPTGRTGVGGLKSHPTSWQHKVGSKYGSVGGRMGRFLGRAAVVLTVAEGFYDIGLLGGCAAACAGE